MPNEQLLTFLVYIDPDFRRTMRDVDDLPPEATVVEINTKTERVRHLLAGAGFKDADNPYNWLSTKRQLRDGRQVRAVKCLVSVPDVKRFKEWVQNPDTIAEGIRYYVPPRTRKALEELGVEATGFYPTRLRRTRETPNQPTDEARVRRHNSLYVYTATRRRGRNKTSAACQLDTAFSDLPEARLHVPGHGRTTARCFEMSTIEAFLKFAQIVLSLYASDKGVHVAVRSPRALAQLNRFLEEVDDADAARIRVLLGTAKALLPEWKWKKGTPVLRQDCTDPPKIPVVDPSPRQDNPGKRKPLEAVSFVVFPGDGSSGLVPTVRLKQLLDILPNGLSFVLTNHEGSPAAALKVNLDNEGAIADFLAKTKCLQSYGFRFVVKPFEAEMWFSKFLDETYEPEDVADLVAPCWTRTLPGTGVNH